MEVFDRESRVLRASSTAPSLAREFVTGVLDRSGVGDLVVDDVVLATSELVTNAVRHAGVDDVVLTVLLAPDRVRVEVVDSSPLRSLDEPRGPSQIGGWGLQLIDEIATTWGFDANADGKAVWCELHR